MEEKQVNTETVGLKNLKSWLKIHKKWVVTFIIGVLVLSIFVVVFVFLQSKENDDNATPTPDSNPVEYMSDSEEEIVDEEELAQNYVMYQGILDYGALIRLPKSDDYQIISKTSKGGSYMDRNLFVVGDGFALSFSATYEGELGFALVDDVAKVTAVNTVDGTELHRIQYAKPREFSSSPSSPIATLGYKFDTYYSENIRIEDEKCLVSYTPYPCVKGEQYKYTNQFKPIADSEKSFLLTATCSTVSLEDGKKCDDLMNKIEMIGMKNQDLLKVDVKFEDKAIVNDN